MKMTYNPNESRFEVTFLYSPNAVTYIKSIGGWRWEPARKVWYSDIPRAVATLAEFADPETRERIPQADIDAAKAAVKLAAESIETSRATHADVEVPSPVGLEYLPYQKAGVRYALQRPNTLIGDEMGLGKTIQAIGAMNSTPSAKRILIICPASLKLNWAREIRKWDTLNRSVGIVGHDADAFTQGVVIINYDRISKHHKELLAVTWDLLIADECHYLKNYKAKRTKYVLGGGKGKEKIEGLRATRKLFLTGTPIVNRPIELFPLLRALLPFEPWTKWKYYTTRYCGAAFNGFGMDLTGASNLEELQNHLRSTIMVRRLKQDVLKELPPKRRQIIVLESDGMDEIVRREKEAYARFEAAPLKSRTAAFAELSALRHDTAVAKIPFVIEHVTDLLEETDKLVVMAHHHDVVDALAEAFGTIAVAVDGRTSIDDRDAAVTRFQNDPTCKLFIGTIKAAGIGITLTAASVVAFAELDWTPGNVTQAEDRLHRIGQVNPVLVQHLVLDKSLDARMVEIIIEKQQNIEKALDKEVPKPQQAVEPVQASPSTEKAPYVPLPMPFSQVTAIHLALRMLAGMCDGVRLKDGAGFNKLDAKFGRSLAASPRLSEKMALSGQKLIRKYHKQIPVEILREALG